MSPRSALVEGGAAAGAAPPRISPPAKRSTLPPAAPAAAPAAPPPPPKSMDNKSPMREPGSGMTWACGTIVSSPNLVGRTRLSPPVPSTKAVGGL